jgi:hypothetical protein
VTCISATLATERKHLSVKDVAAAGGWNDVTTLLKCYPQPDEQSLRAVVEYQSPKPELPSLGR